MAYATIDYGTETPETIDRYGTQQTYSVFARNGRHIDHHWIIPQRTDAIIVRLGLKLLGWVSSPFHGTHTYKLDVHGRSLEILHSADGRMKLILDGRTVYAERKRYRRNKEGERYTVVEEEYDQEQMRELREEERQARLDATRARLAAQRARFTTQEE